MNKSFTIEFEYPLENTTLQVRLQAIAQPLDSSSYLVHSFRSAIRHTNGAAHLLPEQRIKCIRQDGHNSWVHMEQEKETGLSMAIGIAIEKQGA